jgi:hypothetical protein
MVSPEDKSVAVDKKEPGTMFGAGHPQIRITPNTVAISSERAMRSKNMPFQNTRGEPDSVCHAAEPVDPKAVVD